MRAALGDFTRCWVCSFRGDTVAGGGSLLGSGTNVAGLLQDARAGEPGAPCPSRRLLLAHVRWGPLTLVLALVTWPLQWPLRVPWSGRLCLP